MATGPAPSSRAYGPHGAPRPARAVPATKAPPQRRRTDRAADPRRTLAAALDDAASDLVEALAQAEAAHARYVRLTTSTHEQQRVPTDVTSVLDALTQAVEALRAEAADARSRFPDIDAQGRALPSVPPSEDPATVLAWWQALSDGDRHLVLERTPAWAGRTDGLPAAVRDEANREVLAREIEKRRTTEDFDDGQARDLAGLEQLRTLLDPQDTTPGIATPPNERWLYLLDGRTHPLRCAVALGDVDTATHVVLHVPGATTTVADRLVRELQWMGHLRAEMQRIDPSARVAVVDWIGYQAPHDIAVRRTLGSSGMTVLVPGEASDDRYAREAAPLLARACDGVRALRPDARLVGSGHSYGASSFGLALRTTRSVDALMVTGCPGLFTTSLDDLGLARGDLAVGVAGGDLIASLGVFGGHPLRIPGVVMLSPLARTTTYPDGTRTLLKLVVGHEQYYNEGTEMLHNLAAVAVGAHERVRTLRGGRS